ncbi:hypothetical protein BKA81DRAFT_75656 [Phyllosticta paracitricarpa]
MSMRTKTSHLRAKKRTTKKRIPRKRGQGRLRHDTGTGIELIRFQVSTHASHAHFALRRVSTPRRKVDRQRKGKRKHDSPTTSPGRRGASSAKRPNHRRTRDDSNSSKGRAGARSPGRVGSNGGISGRHDCRSPRRASKLMARKVAIMGVWALGVWALTSTSFLAKGLTDIQYFKSFSNPESLPAI